MCRLHHVAIAVAEFDKYVELFKKLGMTVQKTKGSYPSRQIWFNEGIQLKENMNIKLGDNVDHVALGTSSISETLSIALENGCTPLNKGNNWFALPNGTAIELMQD